MSRIASLMIVLAGLTLPLQNAALGADKVVGHPGGFGRLGEFGVGGRGGYGCDGHGGYGCDGNGKAARDGQGGFGCDGQGGYGCDGHAGFRDERHGLSVGGDYRSLMPDGADSDGADSGDDERDHRDVGGPSDRGGFSLFSDRHNDAGPFDDARCNPDRAGYRPSDCPGRQ